MIHRTSSDLIRPVKYAFCKTGTPDGRRVFALGWNHEESAGFVNQMVQLERELEQARRALAERALCDPRFA